MGADTLQMFDGMSMRDNLAEKLRQARKATGKSTRTVAEEIPKQYRVSHTTLANYEKAKFSPSIEVLAVLSGIYERPLNWFLEKGRVLSGVQYRNLPSRVRVADRHRYEGEFQRWLNAYIRIEERLGCPLQASIIDFEVGHHESGSDCARRLREHLGYGYQTEDPIPSVVELLETFGIRVLEQPTELRIDGLAARYGREHVVALNANVSNDRTRLNAAHELAHVLYGDCEGESQQAEELEQRAFEFASHLLLPNAQLKRAFEGHSMVRLLQFKERFGISLAAMVYRAEKTRIINKSTAKKLWAEFARRGWKTSEPGHVSPERATRFEQLLDNALHFETKLSIKQAAEIGAVRPEELRQRIDFAIGGSSPGNDEDGADVLKFPTV